MPLAVTLYPPTDRKPEGTHLTFRVTEPCEFTVAVARASKHNARLIVDAQRDKVVIYRSDAQQKE